MYTQILFLYSVIMFKFWIMYQNPTELWTTGEGVQYKSTYIHVFKEDMYMYVPQLNTYGYCKLLGNLLLHREVKPGFFVKVTALS